MDEILSDEHRINALPLLEPACSEEVLSAAVQLVGMKTILDQLSVDSNYSGIVAQAYSREHAGATIAPFDFLCDALPFFKHLRRQRKESHRYIMRVPTSIVIGDSWRWRPAHLAPEVRQKVLAITYSAVLSAQAGETWMECPKYFYIKALALVAAHEGKNRVALFREEGIPSIPAQVIEEFYPPPERIRLFSIGNYDIAVLDNELVEEAPLLRLTERLFIAYGVRIETCWPDDFPDLGSVLKELRRPRFEQSFQHPSADLNVLRAVAARNDSAVKTNLLNIRSVQLPPIKYWLQLGAMIPALLISMLHFGSYPTVRGAVGIATGAVLMLLVIPSLQVFRCRVVDLRDAHRDRVSRSDIPE